MTDAPAAQRTARRPAGRAAPRERAANGVCLFKRANESELTYRLKWAAWEWLYTQAGCRAIGFEVRLEGPGGRVADVVGVGPGNRVYLIEVKSTRSDTARDNHSARDRQKLARKRAAVNEAARLTVGILEAAAAAARLRDPDSWPRDEAYRQAANDHSRIENRRRALAERMAAFSTKFRDPAYLRLAHCHYIMAPSGLIRPSEVPPLWGLLDETPRARVEAPVKQVRDATTHVLRAIARANTRDMMSAHGVTRTAAGPTEVRFPGLAGEDES